LKRIEADGGDGDLRFEDGRTLRVTSLGKTFFPKPRFTKGDLMRYYARVAPLLLPLIDERPLALRRFPDGLEGSSFYQQNAGGRLPDGVRVAEITDVKGAREPRFVGGDLLTLLYTVQLGCIDVHPWLSRRSSLDTPDHAILDLDPGPGVPFAQVVGVARAVERVLREHELIGALKTSGSRGMHIAIPLSGGLTYAEGAAVTEAVARRAAELEPTLTTMQRRIKSRPRGTIYLDHQQNARGKTVASAYAVRARPGATVSMPVAWRSLRSSLDPAAFTIATVPRRASATRRSWADLLAEGNDESRLRAVLG
jgi:bifunctional non-homologous end joining protein LigD